MERDTSLWEEVDSIPPFTRQLKHLIAVVRGTEEPNCSDKEGLKAVLVLEAVFKSLKTKGPVQVESV